MSFCLDSQETNKFPLCYQLDSKFHTWGNTHVNVINTPTQAMIHNIFEISISTPVFIWNSLLFPKFLRKDNLSSGDSKHQKKKIFFKRVVWKTGI